MATGVDQAAGWGLVGLAGAIFSYYTVWVIILPFVEVNQSIHQFFPPKMYAISGPLLTGVIALFIIGAFVGFIAFKSTKKGLTKGDHSDGHHVQRPRYRSKSRSRSRSSSRENCGKCGSGYKKNK